MKKAAAWALCVLWMMVIFMMSEMPGDVSRATDHLPVLLEVRW